jgi:hypothetical protein
MHISDPGDAAPTDLKKARTVHHDPRQFVRIFPAHYQLSIREFLVQVARMKLNASTGHPLLGSSFSMTY